LSPLAQAGLQMCDKIRAMHSERLSVGVCNAQDLEAALDETSDSDGRWLCVERTPFAATEQDGRCSPEPAPLSGGDREPPESQRKRGIQQAKGHLLGIRSDSSANVVMRVPHPPHPPHLRLNDHNHPHHTHHTHNNNTHHHHHDHRCRGGAHITSVGPCEDPCDIEIIRLIC